MKINFQFTIVVFLSSVLVAGCGGSGSSRVFPNTAPTISVVADQNIEANVTSAAITFTVTDNDVGSLMFSASSDNQQIVPDGGLDLVSNGASGSITVTPMIDMTGEATVTIVVTDQAGLTANSSFVLTVDPQQVSVQQFVRSEFAQAEDGMPVPINAVEFVQDAEGDDFADLLSL